MTIVEPLSKLGHPTSAAHTGTTWCRLPSPSDWADPIFIRTAIAELNQPIAPQRKIWEFVQTVRALDAVGMLDGTKTGLGLGTATEILCFYLPRFAKKIYATDLYATGTNSHWGAGRLSVENAYSRSPIPYPRERLEFRCMDMKQIDLPPESVDFIWSCSSVEHVSDVDEYLQTWAGISRTLRPGGYAAIVTECNLRPGSAYTYHLILWDEALLGRIEAETDLRLVGPLDLSVTDHVLNAPFVLDYLRVFPSHWTHYPQLWVAKGDRLFTSVMLLLQKNPNLSLHQTVHTPNPDIVTKYWQIGRSLQHDCQKFFPPEPKLSKSGGLKVINGRAQVESDGHEEHVAWGPYVDLPSGRYLAKLRLRVDEIPPTFRNEQEVCYADVNSSPGHPTNHKEDGCSIRRNQCVLGQEMECDLTFSSDGYRLYEFRLSARAGVKLTYFGAQLYPLEEGSPQPLGEILPHDAQAQKGEESASPRASRSVNQELAKRVFSRRWFHRIDLGDGLITPGIDNSPRKLIYLNFPTNLTGKTVLDVGAADGFFSFEAERRGASRVLATDQNDGRNFKIAQEALNSNVESMLICAEDLSPEKVGVFDVVLFLGVLYHAPDPLRYLRAAKSVCKEMMIVETHIDALDYPRPAMVFYPDATLNNDPSNFWGPNIPCVTEMLKEVGFNKVTVFPPWRPDRVVIHAFV